MKSHLCRFPAVLCLAVSLVLLAGCGRAVGESCSADSDCDTKTKCILGGSTTVVNSMPTCSDTKKLCSITCSADADCAALGSGYICLHDCFQGSCLQGSH